MTTDFQRVDMDTLSHTPDYHNYSLKELRSVARTVDRDEFPDRYALVIQEIRRREAMESSHSEKTSGKKGRRSKPS